MNRPYRAKTRSQILTGAFALAVACLVAGMSANLCAESHMRELVEQGFEVIVVSDATAAAQLPGLDGYAAADDCPRSHADAATGNAFDRPSH